MSKNEKTLKTIEAMKQQTIGVEIEFVGITRKKAAQVVADYFNTIYRDDDWSVYDKHTIKDQQGRTWMIMRDSSLKARYDSERCELVTPILRYEDIETLQEIVRRLRKAGAVSNASKSCGVHIHIGADGHDAKTLRNLANIMASKETMLSKAINFGDERRQWCRLTDPKFLEPLNKKKPKTMEELADIWYSQGRGDRRAHYHTSRYHMLNLHSTFTKGTVEFRCFNFEEPDGQRRNGLHAGLLKSWIQLCLAMSQQAKDLRTASPKEPQRDNEKFAMRTWMNRMGMIGEEFSTARKLLIKNLDGNAAWRYGNDQAA